MFASSAKQFLLISSLALVSISSATAAWARCGTHVICYADQNNGNSLDYCETPQSDGIVHIEGSYHDRGPQGSFWGGGDMRIKSHTLTRGQLRINYPGWGLVPSAGPSLESRKGEPRRLAWIDIQHDLAGRVSPLSGVRVSISLARGCVVNERLTYRHCELLEWPRQQQGPRDDQPQS